MKKISLITCLQILLIICGSCIKSFGQCPPEQDCVGAILVNQNVYNYTNGSLCNNGGLLGNEIPSNSCLVAGEHYAVWYKFTALTAGKVRFIIIPNNGTPFNLF